MAGSSFHSNRRVRTSGTSANVTVSHIAPDIVSHEGAANATVPMQHNLPSSNSYSGSSVPYIPPQNLSAEAVASLPPQVCSHKRFWMLSCGCISAFVINHHRAFWTIIPRVCPWREAEWEGKFLGFCIHFDQASVSSCKSKITWKCWSCISRCSKQRKTDMHTRSTHFRTKTAA